MAATVINGKKYTVADLMRRPFLIPSSATLKDALRVLIENRSNIGIVVAEDNTFVGTVSTVDIIKEILPDYIENDEVAARFADDDLLQEDVLKAGLMPVCDFVDTHEKTLQADSGLVEAAVIMVREDAGRIVIVDEARKPLGVLTRTEIKKMFGAFLGIADVLEQ